MTRILIILFIFPFFINAQNDDLIKYPQESDIEILYVGDYKKGEFDIRVSDRDWWGLYEKNNISYIRKVKLRIDKLEPDIQYDWEYSISTDDRENCIILFTGLDIKEREIKHYTNNDLISNNIFTFEFGPYHTYLSSKLQTSKNIGQLVRSDFSIHLNYKSDNKLSTQELFIFPIYSEKLLLQLIWAGDLDNDGKTDFIIQLPTLPNNELGYSSGLFLSSKADEGDLVKLVAYFISLSC